MSFRRRNSVLLGVGVVLAAAASAVLTHTYRARVAESGLHAVYRSGTSWDGPLRLETRDTVLSTAALRARAAALGGGPITVEWRGYLIVPSSGRYRFAALADDGVSIGIDRRPVAEGVSRRLIGTLDLNRGLHAVVIRYVDYGGDQGILLLWAPGTGTPTIIPRVLFVPEIPAADEVRLRRALPWLMLALPTFWSAVLLAGAAWGVRSTIRRVSSRDVDREGRYAAIVLLVGGLAFAFGIWWGLPGYGDWAPDELNPGEVLGAVHDRFGHGWATIYPPLHYVILAMFTAPFQVLAGLGLVDLNDLRTATAMFIVQRAVSTVMAVGVLGLVYVIGRTVSPRTGVFAAATVATALPMAYYAKTANVDVPCLFWFALSMVFYLRAHATGATRDFLVFVAAGVAAIATKDQAYGFYVFPALFMVVSACRHAARPVRPPGVPSVRVLLWMAALAIGGLMVCDNVLFNFDGFQEHVRIITGPGSQDYRMYERTVRGHLLMARHAVWQLGSAMSWPIFAASVFGIVTAMRAGVPTVSRLLVPLASYYLTFISAVSYHYDRFFLGPILILAVPAGWWLARCTETTTRGRTLKRAGLSAAFGYALLRVAALDAMMAFDSRYEVEQWLLGHARPDERLAGVGVYLPRQTRLWWTPLAQNLDELARTEPDFVIVNVGYLERSAPDSDRGRFYEELSKGRTPYRCVLRYRTSVPWSPLAWEARFRNGKEDGYSNLTKVNPLIEVYAR